MKLKLSKKQPQPVGRQRLSSQRSAPPAYSYHAQRSSRPDAPQRQPTNPATKKRGLLSLQFLVKRSGAIIVALVIVASLISLFYVSNDPRVVLLDQGNAYAFQATNAYQSAAKQQLASSFWNHNKLTINTGGAAASLQQRFPELSQVSITLPLVGHRPIYYLRANAPTFVLQSVNGTFVLDASGKSLLTKDGTPERLVTSLPTITDQTGLKVQLGKQVISSSNAGFIEAVINTLAAKKITIDSLVLPTDSVQELDAKVTGQPYTIKFDMHDSGGARQQIGTYLATINMLTTQSKTPAQYIDVRVPGRVYYQ